VGPNRRRDMFKLEFTTDNAAFQQGDFEGDGLFAETSSILRLVAVDVACGCRQGTVRDSNGNTVGQWALTEE
jgi:hypothetical protein